jgi:ATP-dependent RNA helicase DeaD
MLFQLLDVEDPQLAIIFCHTKRDVDEVSLKLGQMGYNAGALHGDFTQAQRDEVMGKFKAGMLDILVATDVAARGLDIKDVTHVVNYSIRSRQLCPQDREDGKGRKSESR